MNGKRRLIGSFNHGTMANALPQGIGAQASQPGRQVVAMWDDRGIAILLGELTTLRQMHLLLPDRLDEHGGGTPVDQGQWSLCRRACSPCRSCSSGCRHHSAVISATAMRAEDSSTIAFFVA